MADEVSAALLGEMRAALALKTETDARIGAIRKKLNEKNATQADIADYSDRLGELLRDTLRETLTPEALPNETLYYNILRDTVGVMLKNAHRKVNEAAIEAQKVIDEAQGLHLNAEAAPYPQKRADDLFYKVGAPGTPYETAMKRLAEPVATLTRAFHDDHIRHNADVRFRAGMGPKIVRTAAFNCCEWCSSLAGTYDYEDVRDTGNDVFRRHERCKCIVDYVCDGKSQAVWSKKYFETDEETLRQRMQHRLETKQKTPAEMDAEFEAWQKMKRTDEATLERREIYRASIGDASQETLRARSEYGLERRKQTPEQRIAEREKKLDELKKQKDAAFAEMEKKYAKKTASKEKDLDKKTKVDTIENETKISGSQLFSDNARKELYQKERIITGNRYETGILFDSNGKQIFAKKGSASEVAFSTKEIKQMKDGILTHNHPNGSCFSPEDLNVARLGRLTEIRAAVNDGVYVFRPNGAPWPDEISNLEGITNKMLQVEDSVRDRCKDFAAQEGMTMRQYLQYLDRESMNVFCEQYGFKFSWEAKKESEFYK